VSDLGDALDCQSCGACCASPHDPLPGVAGQPPTASLEPFVAVDPLDYDLLGPERVRRLVVLDPLVPSGLALAVRKTARGGAACACLQGDPGHDERVACQVYEVRPHACREVRAGGTWCRESRRLLGFETG